MKAVVKSVVVGLLVVFLSQSVFAAETPGKYTVQPSDTLWDLSATYHKDPLKWAEVLGANPFLKEKGRVIDRPDGRVIVLIRPGEKLAGLEQIGVKAEPIPFSSLWPVLVPSQTQPASAQAVPPALTAVTERAESVVVNMGAGTATVASVPFYQMPILGIPLWVLVALAGIVAGAMFKWYRAGLIFYRSPATAGPPIVQGGISTSQPNAITTRFDRIAERRYGERNPTADLSTAVPERISAIESGTPVHD